MDSVPLINVSFPLLQLKMSSVYLEGHSGGICLFTPHGGAVALYLYDLDFLSAIMLLQKAVLAWSFTSA